MCTNTVSNLKKFVGHDRLCERDTKKLFYFRNKPTLMKQTTRDTQRLSFQQIKTTGKSATGGRCRERLELPRNIISLKITPASTFRARAGGGQISTRVSPDSSSPGVARVSTSDVRRRRSITCQRSEFDCRRRVSPARGPLRDDFGAIAAFAEPSQAKSTLCRRKIRSRSRPPAAEWRQIEFPGFYCKLRPRVESKCLRRIAAVKGTSRNWTVGDQRRLLKYDILAGNVAELSKVNERTWIFWNVAVHDMCYVLKAERRLHMRVDCASTEMWMHDTKMRLPKYPNVYLRNKFQGRLSN